jgi:hypothetical protein
MTNTSRILVEVKCPHSVNKFVRLDYLRSGRVKDCSKWRECAKHWRKNSAVQR